MYPLNKCEMVYCNAEIKNPYQGSAAGEEQQAEFTVPCHMRKSHVALAGLNH